MNKIIITGRLGRDIEMKVSGNGSEYAQFTVACNREPKKGQDQQTDWFNCTAFSKTALFLQKYFKKGDGIVITGRMESKSSEAHGEKRIYWVLLVESVEFPVGGKRSETVEQTEPVNTTAALPDAIDTDIDMPF